MELLDAVPRSENIDLKVRLTNKEKLNMGQYLPSVNMMASYKRFKES